MDNLLETIEDLQDKVDDLRWRMNAICNFISKHFPEKIDYEMELHMREEYPKRTENE